MWLFYSPKDYSEMVEKISKSVFVTLAILFYVLSCINNEFKELIEKISFGAIYDFYGLELNLALLYLPLLGGLFEHMFKIHDKISKVLGIRKAYDRKVVVENILKKAGRVEQSKSLKDETINSIISNCFYRYVSSTNPKIDSHYITLVLNEWCWFWIFLDILCLFILFGVCFLILKWSFLNLALVLGVIVIILILMLLTIKTAINYSKKEIDAIFRLNDMETDKTVKKEATNGPVKSEIERELDSILKNALHSK